MSFNFDNHVAQRCIEINLWNYQGNLELIIFIYKQMFPGLLTVVRLKVFYR